jgi:hypothetical protein
MAVFSSVVEIVVLGTLNETAGLKNIDQVYHYRLSSGSLDTRAAICTAFLSAVHSVILGQLSADYVTVSGKCRLLDDATEQYSTVTSTTPGQIALPRLPGDLSIVLPLRCVERGRSFRGRKHYRGIPTASVLKDELTAGAVTAWAALVTAVGATFSSANGSVYKPMVLSRILSQLRTNPTTIVGSDVNAVLLNKTIGTFRRSKEKTQR